MTTLCPKPVFVADGWPFGQCLRTRGHAGLCDVYDGSDDAPAVSKKLAFCLRHIAPWETPTSTGSSDCDACKLVALYAAVCPR